MAIIQGSPDNPVQFDPWQTIVNVGWSGSVGVLIVDFPDGVELSFMPDGDLPATLDVTAGQVLHLADLLGNVTALGFDALPIVGELYGPTTTSLWVIDTVAFPDTIILGTTYDELKAMYVAGAPTTRWQEISDLRMLQGATPGVIAASYMGYPHDPNAWASWDYGTYTASDGTITQGYLPPPGEPFYGFGEHISSETTAGRNLLRGAWVLDFSSDKIAGGTVTISNDDPHTDDKIIGGYAMPFRFSLYPRGVGLMVSDFGIAADKPAAFSGSMSAPYDRGGALVSVNNRGFV